MVLGTKGLIICKRFGVISWWPAFDLQGYDQPKLQDFQVWKLPGGCWKYGEVNRQVHRFVGWRFKHRKMMKDVPLYTYSTLVHVAFRCIELDRYMYIFISMLSCTYIYIHTHIFHHSYIYTHLCTSESTYLYIHVLAWCIWGVSSPDLIYACLSSIVVQPYMI